MEDKLTPCECPLSGFCTRHNMNKSPHYHHLCQTNIKYFNLWERCSGPGQEFIDCAKTSEERKPLALPEKKKPCNCDQKKLVEEAQKQEDLKKNLPSLWQQAKNLAGSVTEHVITGMKKTPEEIQKERMEICQGCEFFIRDQKRCGKCGCYMEVKTKMESAKCPIGRW